MGFQNSYHACAVVDIVAGPAAQFRQNAAGQQSNYGFKSVTRSALGQFTLVLDDDNQIDMNESAIFLQVYAVAGVVAPQDNLTSKVISASQTDSTIVVEFHRLDAGLAAADPVSFSIMVEQTRVGT